MIVILLFTTYFLGKIRDLKAKAFMRLSYFFSKKECILAILEGLIFKIFRPVGPNHCGASLVTEPQPPQSQKCGYGPVLVPS